MRKFISAALLAIPLFTLNLHAAPRGFCAVHLRELRSTQLFLGMTAVEKMTDDLVKRGLYLLDKKIEWKDYLTENAVTTVKGPNDSNGKPLYFVVNGNHHVEAANRIQALQNLTWDERWVYANEALDFSQLNWRSFWEQMNEQKLILLLNQRGTPTTFERFRDDQLLEVLKETPISGLINDTGRSMAEYLLDVGMIEKPKGQLYWQFQWAVALRKIWKNAKVDPLKNISKAKKMAKAFARSDDAKGLPGFKNRAN